MKKLDTCNSFGGFRNIGKNVINLHGSRENDHNMYVQ